MSRPTHYDVLGVARTAEPAEVRRAYLARARSLHPDRLQGLPPEQAASMARAMQDVNEAWRVLRAPASRAAYDARLDAPSAGAARPRPARPAWGDPDVDLDPTPYYTRPEGMVEPAVSVVRGLPWLVALVVLGAIFVFTAFAGGTSDEDRRTGSDLVGRCVQSQPGVGLVEVPCDGANEGRVDLVASRQSQCPADAIARPVPGEGTWVCLRPAG